MVLGWERCFFFFGFGGKGCVGSGFLNNKRQMGRLCFGVDKKCILGGWNKRSIYCSNKKRKREEREEKGKGFFRLEKEKRKRRKEKTKGRRRRKKKEKKKKIITPSDHNQNK